MCEEEYFVVTFSNIYASLSFDLCTTFYLEYLTNAVTTGPDKFFHNYSYYAYKKIQKVLLLEFVTVVYGPCHIKPVLLSCC